MHKYDDARWVQMFRFTKRSMFSLAQLLSPSIQKQNTKYCMAVPVIVRLACTLFKLSHGATLLICSELFAVGRSTVSIMLHDVVHAINDLLRAEMKWPSFEQVPSISRDFQDMCGLPSVLGAIDGTHFAVSKPKFGPADYFYFKSSGYAITCQAVVDSSKKFLDLHVGMPGSCNDAHVLRQSALFERGQRQTLWDAAHTFHGFSPYLVGDVAYLLLPWLMVPHRRVRAVPATDALFNRKLSRGRAVVENAFGLLKLTFRELHLKCELDITFVPDVVFCCCILYNVLLQQSHDDVERLLEVVGIHPAAQEVGNPHPPPPPDLQATEDDLFEEERGMTKRTELGVFLGIQRGLRP